MEKISNYVVEPSYQTEVIIKSKPEPVFNYEIVRDGKIIGFLKVRDKRFVDYLYALGVNIKHM